MKILKPISVIFSLVILVYIGLSLLILNGKLIYTTSFNESTIEGAKNKGLFVSSKLPVIAEGDSLSDWKNNFDIWSSKRYEIKYFGVLFFWTYTDSKWRYLNVKFKNERLNDDWCVKYRNETYCSECCTRVGSNVGDTVTIPFYRFKEDKKIGILKIVVQ